MGGDTACPFVVIEEREMNACRRVQSLLWASAVAIDPYDHFDHNVPV